MKMLGMSERDEDPSIDCLNLLHVDQSAKDHPNSLTKEQLIDEFVHITWLESGHKTTQQDYVNISLSITRLGPS